MTYTGNDQPAKKPGPKLAIALAVIVIGTVVGIFGLAEGVAGGVHDVKGLATGITPTQTQRHLDTGTWEIYVGEDSTVLQPSDVTVTGSDGAQIPTRPLGSNTTETITKSGRSYDGQVEFTILQGGEYDVKVTGPPGTPILLSKSLGDVVKHAVGWFILMGVGILVGFIGVVLLIVGVVRRRRVNRPVMAGGGYAVASFGGGQAYQPPVTSQPAAGWYPDPSIPGTQRYWDGTKWTDQTHTT